MNGDLEGFAGGGTAGLVAGLTALAGGKFCAARPTGMAVSRRARASRLMWRIVRLEQVLDTTERARLICFGPWQRVRRRARSWSRLRVRWCWLRAW